MIRYHTVVLIYGLGALKMTKRSLRLLIQFASKDAGHCTHSLSFPEEVHFAFENQSFFLLGGGFWVTLMVIAREHGDPKLEQSKDQRKLRP